MLTQAKKFEEILTYLSILRYIFKSRSKKGMFDLNKQAEPFFCKILNDTYSWNLQNMNRIHTNFPAIDLGDYTNRICVQVTSDNCSEKIKKTIEKFIEHGLDKDFDRLVIFILTDVKGYTTTFDTQGKISFDKTKDILDIDDLLNEIEGMTYKDISKLHEYILQELAALRTIFAENGSLLANVESVPYDFPDDIDSFTRFHQFEDEEFQDVYEEVNELYNLLLTLTKETREYLYALLVRSQPPKGMFSSDTIYTLPQDLKSYLKKPDEELKKYFEILEEKNCVYYEGDDYPKRIEICAPSKLGINTLKLIKEFTKTDKRLKSVIVNCDFETFSA